MTAELAFLDLVEAASLISTRQASARQVVEAVLDRTEAIAPDLNCFISIDREAALSEADDRDRAIVRDGVVGPLHGIPVSIKDTFPTANMRTTAGSPILADWIPEQDAVAVADLRRAGAVIIGKTSAYQFAFGSAHPDFGDVKNPWDARRCCGGSSSGSAAAVAAGLGYGSLGSDAAGSVRSPGALCGVVAMKPTLDLISAEGAIPAAYTMDHAGLFGRCVADVHRQLLAFPAYRRIASEQMEPRGLKGLRVGIPKRHAGDTDFAIAHGVEQVVSEATERLVQAGALVREIELPRLDEAQMLMVLIFAGEINEFHLPWLLTRKNDYPADVAALLTGSQSLPAVAYVRAQRIRQLLIQRYAAAMADVDVVATPVMPITAWPIGEAEVSVGGMPVSALTTQTWHCVPFNLTGHPALSVPAGLADGLPVGLQLVGHMHADEALLGVAASFEEVSGRLLTFPPPTGTPTGKEPIS
jgi:aspartyl-tRNA(Asn)/glutamyl-tRNA(Gln) amidotransferase subunit A